MTEQEMQTLMFGDKVVAKMVTGETVFGTVEGMTQDSTFIAWDDGMESGWIQDNDAELIHIPEDDEEVDELDEAITIVESMASAADDDPRDGR